MHHYKIKTVDRVVDGDTVDVIIDLGFDLLHKLRIRLLGINTPETRTRDLEEKAAGLAAKEYLAIMLADAQDLTLKTEKTGKFGRYLGTLYDGDKDINRTMVTEGFAEEYHGGKR